MRTLNVSISDGEYDHLGLTDDNLSYSQFLTIVSNQLAQQTLAESLRIAETHGLSEMTMDEITEEVKAVRRHAKDNN